MSMRNMPRIRASVSMVMVNLGFRTCMHAQGQVEGCRIAGAEFYVQAWPELEGKQFAEVSLLPRASPASGITVHSSRMLRAEPPCWQSICSRAGAQLLLLWHRGGTAVASPCLITSFSDGGKQGHGAAWPDRCCPGVIFAGLCGRS